MSLDYQKRKHSEIESSSDSKPNKKERRYCRRHAKGKAKQEIEQLCNELIATPSLDIDDTLNAEASEASYCHFHGPCKRCLGSGEQE